MLGAHFLIKMMIVSQLQDESRVIQPFPPLSLSPSLPFPLSPFPPLSLSPSPLTGHTKNLHLFSIETTYEPSQPPLVPPTPGLPSEFGTGGG